MSKLNRVRDIEDNRFLDTDIHEICQRFHPLHLKLYYSCYRITESAFGGVKLNLERVPRCSECSESFQQAAFDQICRFDDDERTSGRFQREKG